MKRANPGVNVKLIGGSSGKLTAQIKNGAPFDVFLSADREYPEDLAKTGYAASEVRTYVRGSLILFAKKGLDFSRGLAALKEVSTVAVAKPEIAPYGKAAFEALEKSNLLKDLEKKIVFAENISQAAQFSLTAADAGFFNKSVLFTPAFAAYAEKEGKNWIEVPADLYSPIDQGAVILKYGAGKKEAAAFFDYLFSEPAKSPIPKTWLSRKVTEEKGRTSHGLGF